MRTAALVLAILGGVFGILFGLFAIAVGGFASAFDESGNSVVGLGVSAIAAAVFGIVCGGLNFAEKRPRLAAGGMIAAAIWHLISISFFGALGFLFLLFAGVFGWFGRARTLPGADR